MKTRIIALIDCDSFFVSCERVDNPSLWGKPVCSMTGHGSKGIIVSRSSEAKALGIKMGTPYFMIQKQFPQAICIPARHQRYEELSRQVMSIIRRFTPDVEEVSIDEAYADLTGLNLVYKCTYTELIKKIRSTILEQTHIPVSIGISTSKTLAKLASDKSKNIGGIFAVAPDKIIETIGNIRIEDVCGIGHQYCKTLAFNDVYTIDDFLHKDNAWIKKIMGINGLNLKFELSGLSVSAVNSQNKAPQSIQDTASFAEFSNNFDFLHSELNRHVHNASRKLRHWNGFCCELEVILRTKNFDSYTASTLFPNATNSEFSLRNTALNLLKQIYRNTVLYRSVGIDIKKISYNQEIQTSLFDNMHCQDDKLSHVLDELNDKFGTDIIKIGF